VLLDVVAMGHGRDQAFATDAALELGLQRVLGANVIGQDAEALAPRGGVVVGAAPTTAAAAAPCSCYR
jgi:hypothetical protein